MRIPHRFSQHGVKLALGELARPSCDRLPRHYPRNREGADIQLVALREVRGLSFFNPLAQLQQLAIFLFERADSLSQRVFVGGANRGKRG
jgi:hypothetical protein